MCPKRDVMQRSDTEMDACQKRWYGVGVCMTMFGEGCCLPVRQARLSEKTIMEVLG